MKLLICPEKETSVYASTDDLLRWRDWLVENVPDNVLTAAAKESLIKVRETQVQGFINSTRTRDMFGPLDFFVWSNHNVMHNVSPFIVWGEINVDLAVYLNNWFGGWPVTAVEVMGLLGAPEQKNKARNTTHVFGTIK